jgi:hypothetical protein
MAAEKKRRVEALLSLLNPRAVPKGGYFSLKLAYLTRAWLRSVMGFSFTNIAFDALNCGSRDHRNGLHALLDRDLIRVLEPVTVGIRILDSLGRS